MSAIKLTDDSRVKPEVSFAIACYNALPFLAAAIQSALGQTETSVEVLVVDDGSSDASLAVAEEFARKDPRVRVLKTPKNGGPSAARNIALDVMHGEWFAVLDSDDWLDPQRSRTLIDIARKTGADFVADNLQVFGEKIETQLHFPRGVFEGGRWLGLDEYFSRSCLFGSSPGPGFLKPMIRKEVIDTFGLRYNPDLRIGEDDELIVRLLIAGSRYFVIADAMYHYRKHQASLSHRLSLANAQKMLDAERNIRKLIGERASSVAYRKRWTALQNGLAFTQAIESLKSRDFLPAIATCLRHPGMLPLFGMPLRSVLKKVMGKV